MGLRILTWLVSIGIHAGLVLAMFMTAAGGAAIEQGSGEDIMVVEQGIALQGIAKLGQDAVSVEAVEAPPVMTAAAQPLPQEAEPVEEQKELPVEEVPDVKPIEDQVVASEAGPQQELVEPKRKEIEEPKPKEVTQPLPQQVATIQQETVVAMRESSGEAKKGGDTTAHRAYLGKLRDHLERNKVNPRTQIIGTAVVQLTVKSDGEVLSSRITKSSGHKMLDDAAIASIEKASPFPPMPSSLHEDTIQVSVPFKFSVR